MAIFLTYSFIVLCAVGTLGFYLLYFATDKQLVIANIIIGNVTRLLSFISICLTIAFFFMNQRVVFSDK
ncbi:hypothetical protein KC460_03240 [Candidatus Dependentiae bacterium]|nr:hypothetical protein [Candidatus Dependentiae bacterium]